MNSMTGFGRATIQRDGLELAVEISSVNRKTLEVQVSGPKDWFGLEIVVQENLRAAASRGKVYVQVKVLAFDEDAGLAWDDQQVERLLDRLEGACARRNIPFQPDARLVFDIVSAVKQPGNLPEWERVEPVLKEALDAAIQPWLQMRSAEGEALRRDLSGRLDTLEGHLAIIRSAADTVVDDQRKRLLSRLEQAGLPLSADDERVLKELALFADRCDISEEITRLEHHYASLREVLGATGPVGRKMDFIAQEIFRELNTIGSKAAAIAVSQAAIDSKNELERLREQVANVE
ncbi:MAG: YicC/YloC family endoribonuclease [Opitutales bacterium]